MPYSSVRGIEHYYQWITQSQLNASGEHYPTGKPVLVFVHGWAGSARYWESTAIALTHEFDCLLYDLRGFGRTRLPKSPHRDLDYELHTYADDLALLLDTLGINQITINAHSTGASIAVLFLNRYPHRVNRAILTCNGIFPYDPKAFSAFHKFGGFVVKFRPHWLLSIPFVERFFMARFLHQPIPLSQQRNFLEDFLRADDNAALGTIYTAVSQRAAETMPQEFTQISMPTLLVCGEYDQIIPPPMGQQAANLNPNIQFQVLTKTGHFPMLEDPETYLQLIDSFLSHPIPT
ncbi:MAG: alpha/beta fold hydrolase [Synechococcales cyanobacterium]